MINFPQKNVERPIMQANRGNTLGTLWSTFNMDFQSNPGRIRVGKKLTVNTSSGDLADLGTPYAFARYVGYWWAICGNKLFRSATQFDGFAGPFVEDTTSGALSDYTIISSDIAQFNARLWVTTTDKLYSRTGSGAWEEKDTMTAGIPHKMAYMRNQNRLYYIDEGATGNPKISSIDTSDVVANTPGDYFLDMGLTDGGNKAITICADFSNLYIAMMSESDETGGRKPFGSIRVWDGVTSQISSSIVLPTSAALAMTVLNEVLYIVDSAGRILKYTGYGIEELARLPFDDRHGYNSSLFGYTSQYATGKFIHPNGFIGTKNNTLLLLINARTADNTSPALIENMQSGIWELDLATNSLTHKHSFNYKTFTGTDVSDFGQSRIAVAGALAEQNVDTVYSSTYGISDIIAGASYYTDSGVDSADASAIFALSGRGGTSDPEGQKLGYFVTTFIDSASLQDTWQKIAIKYRKYLNGADKIILKYRTTEADPVYADITWTSPTSFTTTTDLTHYWTSGYGGEIEVTQGKGGGTCAHITNITNNAGTYTVTIDEQAPGAVSTTAVVRVQSWVKIGEASDQGTESKVLMIGKNSERIQIKVVMHFTGDGEFHEFNLVNKPHIQLE